MSTLGDIYCINLHPIPNLMQQISPAVEMTKKVVTRRNIELSLFEVRFNKPWELCVKQRHMNTLCTLPVRRNLHVLCTFSAFFVVNYL